MVRRLMLPFSLLLMLSAFPQAQNHGAAASVHPSFSQPTGAPRGVRGRFSEFRSHRPFRNNTLVFGDPYLYDYADYAAEPTPPPPPQQVVVAPAVQPPNPPEPLMLEWQNDRWVRVNPTGELVPSKSSADVRAPDRSTHENVASATPPIAVLVFTDGHTEEVSRYIIMGKVMYANADYWTTGTWTKKILLSSLDLRASMRANQERGAKLVLPGGPNEVVIGP